MASPLTSMTQKFIMLYRIASFVFLLSLISASVSASTVTSRLYVLQYHHISEETPPATSTTPSLFNKQLEYLKENDFIVVSLAEGLARIRKNETTHPLVAITFDDGFRNNYETAFPILKQYGYPATIFINPGHIEAGSTEHLSWKQAREMQEHNIQFENHGLFHQHFLKNYAEDGWLEPVKQSIDQARSLIKKRLGHSTEMLAYPYGEFSQELKEWLASQNITAFGQQSGPIGNKTDLQALPRFPVPDQYGTLDQLKEKLSTLPYQPQDIDPASNILTSEQNPPTLSFVVSDDLVGKLNCFASGRGAISVQRQQNTIQVSTDEPFQSRRFRYNCTAAAGGDQFYWYSFPWVIPSIPE